MSGHFLDPGSHKPESKMVSLCYMKFFLRAFSRGILSLDITRIHPPRTGKALKGDADTLLTIAI
jgi:hypothetical protein